MPLRLAIRPKYRRILDENWLKIFNYPEEEFQVR